MEGIHLIGPGFIVFLVITAINLAALYLGFIEDWPNGWAREEATYIILRIINTILWFMGMGLMYKMNANIVTHFLVIAVTGVLCCVGIKEMMEKWREGKWVGFYLGIKLTIFLIAVLKSFPFGNGFLTSLLCIVIAIVCIVMGFQFKVKSFRLYGLVLTMASTAKLILIDIYYDNSIGRVVSFLLCGLLCFGINLIYNMVSKKMVNQ